MVRQGPARRSPVCADQTAAVPSALAATRRVPSELNATWHTMALWLSGPTSNLPVWAFQRTVPPLVTVAMNLPSGLYAARCIPPGSSSEGIICVPVWASQMRAVLSSLAVRTRVPSGLNSAPVILPPSCWMTASSVDMRARTCPMRMRMIPHEFGYGSQPSSSRRSSAFGQIRPKSNHDRSCSSADSRRKPHIRSQ